MSQSSQILLEIGDGISLLLGLPTIPSWTTKERPQKIKPGTLGYNIQTNSLEYYDGSDWFTGAMKTA